MGELFQEGTLGRIERSRWYYFLSVTEREEQERKARLREARRQGELRAAQRAREEARAALDKARREAERRQERVEVLCRVRDQLQTDMRKLLGDRGEEISWRMTAHLASRAFREHPATEEDLERLQGLFEGRPGERRGVLQAVQAGTVLYDEQFHIGPADTLGTFWTGLIREVLPPFYGGALPEVDGLAGMCLDLSKLDDRFRDAEERGTLYDELMDADALPRRWEEMTVLTPDREKLLPLVRDRDFSVYEWAERDLLVAVWPQLADRWPEEDLRDMDPGDILPEIYREDPALAIAMWRLLLDTEEAHLGDRETAEELIGDWLWEIWLDGEKDPMLLRPILTEMDGSERFTEQLFGKSAYVDLPQLDLLKALHREGKDELVGSLWGRIESKADPTDEDFNDFMLDLLSWDTPKGEERASIPPDETETPAPASDWYRWCVVRTGPGPHRCTYSTEDLPVRPGDWVEVPYGSTLRQGLVLTVYVSDHPETRWPPEKTRSVLRILPGRCGKDGK